LKSILPNTAFQLLPSFNYFWQNKKTRKTHYNSPANIVQKFLKRYADEQVSNTVITGKR